MFDIFSNHIQVAVFQVRDMKEHGERTFRHNPAGLHASRIPLLAADSKGLFSTQFDVALNE